MGYKMSGMCLCKILFLLAFFSYTLQVAVNDGKDLMNPDEEMHEDGLKCQLNILHKIDNDRGDGKYTGNQIEHGHTLNKLNLNKLFRFGVEQGIDITTLLLQYYNIRNEPMKIQDGNNSFEFNLRKAISHCGLNMTKAIKRCEYAYRRVKGGAQCDRVLWGGNSEQDYAPFVTLKCPPGYNRYGCCTCLRVCGHHSGLEEEEGDNLTWTNVDYCIKKAVQYTEQTRDTQKIIDPREWEIFEGSYVRKCPKGYTRVGDYKCISECPLGWPDLGDKCEKAGPLLMFPFVWQVGDGQMKMKETSGSQPK